MAYSKEQWEKAKGYYEAGLSLAKIKDKTGIARNTISQRAKKEQWEQGKNTDYIDAKVITAEKKGTILEQSGTVALQIADDIAEERTKHLVYFQNSALKNQSIANKSVDAIENMMEKAKDQEEKDHIAITGLSTLKDHAAITRINKETVLGKDAETQVQINNTNAQQNNNNLEWSLED